MKQHEVYFPVAYLFTSKLKVPMSLSDNLILISQAPSIRKLIFSTRVHELAAATSFVGELPWPMSGIQSLAWLGEAAESVHRNANLDFVVTGSDSKRRRSWWPFWVTVSKTDSIEPSMLLHLHSWARSSPLTNDIDNIDMSHFMIDSFTKFLPLGRPNRVWSFRLSKAKKKLAFAASYCLLIISTA